MSSTKTDLEIFYEEHATKHEDHSEGMGPWRARSRLLDQLGFHGDVDVPVLGLDEMENELTMEAAERMHHLAPNVNTDRHRYTGVPWSLDQPGHRDARVGEHMGDQHGDEGHASYGWGWDNGESDE